MTKELGALERIETFLKENCKHYKQDVGYIKQALIKSQEQEKVLEIIKKKHISIWRFRNIVFGYEQKQNGNFVNNTYEYYKEHFGYYHEGFEFELLDEEEFDTLKGWLDGLSNDES